MNISLEEQIEHMRRDYDWYFGRTANPKQPFDIKMCASILATLEAVKKEAILKDIDHILNSLAPTKPDTGH
jgi:hypothetical protein